MIQTTTPEPEWIGVSDFGRRMNVSRWTAGKWLAQWEGEGLLPGHVGRGRCKRWQVTDVERAFEKAKHTD